MHLTEKQLEVREADGHLLVTGGPGSGKTTVSILKAGQIAEHHLRPGQKVIFLSFARSTVSRVEEAVEYEQIIPPVQKRCVDVETYHSFFWRILKTHGYLVGLPRQLTILTPPDEAVALSGIRSGNLTDDRKVDKKTAEKDERTRLAMAEGRVCFDLFAYFSGKILHGSERIRRLIAAMYPVIILDEFQDTNAPQWRVVQALGVFCRLIALADPEQRIYDWIGADPGRLNHFREAFTPSEIDLSTDNHRNADTEITMFGNDLLTGKFRQKAYKGIAFYFYPQREGSSQRDRSHDLAMTKLVTETDAARQRLIKQGVIDWSLAILVPTKKMTRLVSDALCQPPAGMTEVPHSAVIERGAAILAAEIIALLLQPAVDGDHVEQLIDLLCNYFQGKGGDKPTQAALKEADDIRKAYDDLEKGKVIRKNNVLSNVLAVYEKTRALVLTGAPDKDWQAMRRMLKDGPCKRLKEVANEVQNIRDNILDQGTQFRQALSRDWRDNSGYFNALSITRKAFMQEHFSMNAKPEAGVVVMNMHKAKGKQFDEVIIFEGWNRYNRIVYSNDRKEINDQARQNFRVSVTRSKRQTTILTSQRNPCILLPRS